MGLLWLTVLGLVSTAALKYSELIQTVKKVEFLEQSVRELREYRVAQQTESLGRWDEILRRLSRIESKLDRGNQ